MLKKAKWIYLCMHLYTYVYLACNRKVVGSSPTRSELFLKQIVLGLYYTHTHTYIYIHISLTTFFSVGSLMFAHVYMYIRKHFNISVAETRAYHICMHLYHFVLVHMYIYVYINKHMCIQTGLFQNF